MGQGTCQVCKNNDDCLHIHHLARCLDKQCKTKYVDSGNENKSDCPSGSSAIDEISACQSAADWLGLPFAGSMESNFFPSGCYLWNSSTHIDKNVHFNMAHGANNILGKGKCKLCLQAGTEIMESWQTNNVTDTKLLVV